MKYSSIHVHDCYSDGKGYPHEFAEYALKNNMEVLGFSAHVPIPIENEWSMKLENMKYYVEDILNLKEKYRDSLKIYLGMEIDYIKDMDVLGYADIGDVPLDYFIGAVHYIYCEKLKKYITVDPDGEEFNYIVCEGYDGNGIDLAKSYYSSVREMIQAYNPFIVAHLDILKKNNKNSKYFDEKSYEYKNQIDITTDLILSRNAIVEINTGGMSRGYTEEPYPSGWILHECRKKNIGIMINSDAHYPDMLTYGYDKAIEIAKNAGYEDSFIFFDNEFVKRSF